MCESNVYLLKSGREELLMEKVDRLIPGDDDTIFLENVFGERRQIKARIKEMELVHHRIILTETAPAQGLGETGEIWLEPISDHGHFHEGEAVVLRLCRGHNMQPDHKPVGGHPQVYRFKGAQREEIALKDDEGKLLLDLGESADGVITVCACHKEQDADYYAKMIVEIGHHNHQELEPVGLPLEIVPARYQHAHIGEYYEIMVLYHGEPLAGVKVNANYTGNRQADTYTDDQGKARIFLSARGNYLLVCRHDRLVSSYTLVKGY